MNNKREEEKDQLFELYDETHWPYIIFVEIKTPLSGRL